MHLSTGGIGNDDSSRSKSVESVEVSNFSRSQSRSRKNVAGFQGRTIVGEGKEGTVG